MSWTYRSKKDGLVVQMPDNVEAKSPEYYAILESARKKASMPTMSAREQALALRPAQEVQPSQSAPAETSAQGLMVGAARGLAPTAAGAALGAMAGAPFAGVGAVPGAIAGAGIMGATQMLGDPLVDGINAIFGTQWTRPTDAMMGMLTQLGVPEAQTEAEKIVQAFSSGGGGAGGTAALFKTLEKYAPGLIGKFSQVLGANPAVQTASGALASGASETAKQEGLPELAQAGIGIGAGLLPGMAPSVARGVPALMKPATGELAQTAEEAARLGIPYKTSDAFPPKGKAASTAQDLAEQNPVSGMAKARATQQESRTSAVRNLFDEYGVDTSNTVTDDVMADILKTRGDELEKLTKAKGEVLGKVASDTPVPMTATTAKIDEQIAYLNSLKTEQVKPIIGILQDWKKSVQGQSLANIETLRKQVGDAFKASGLESVRSTGEKVLSSIYGSVKQDMGDYIKANGTEADFTKWMVTNKKLAEMAGELEDSAFKNLLKRGKTSPQVVKEWLFSTEPNKVKKVYEGLSQEGKDLAKRAILTEVADRMEKAGNVSPDSYLAVSRKLGGPLGIFFGGDEGRALEGLNKVLQATKRAQASVGNPATGNRLGGTMAGLGAVGLGAGGGVMSGVDPTLGALAGIGSIGVHGLASRIYESKPVRDILIRLSEAPKGSDAEKALLAKLVTIGALETEKNVIEPKEQK